MKRLNQYAALAGATILQFLGVGLSDILAAAPVPSAKPATYPAWWFERELVKRSAPPTNMPTWPDSYAAANDFAGLNQGQLKAFALAAFDELGAKLAARGGAGTAALNLAKTWCLVDPATGLLQRNAGLPIAKTAVGAQDFAAVNLGQLKNVAKTFYDRLIEIHFFDGYPWTSSQSDDSEFAMANIGQAKALFSFDLLRDSDQDGMTDLQEGIAGPIGGGPSLDTDGDGTPDYLDTDPDNDGLHDGEEMHLGFNPVLSDTSPLDRQISYDALGRLEAVGTASYRYDAEGNLESAGN